MLLVALLLILCQVASARDLKIMGTTSLTGKHQSAGVECKRAIEMWVDNVNSRGGVEIKVAGGSSECTAYSLVEEERVRARSRSFVRVEEELLSRDVSIDGCDLAFTLRGICGFRES